jgi:hypothetical protein
MLVNILLLRVVNAHERLNRFDHALRVANDVAVGIGGRKAIGQPAEQPRRCTISR